MLGSGEIGELAAAAETAGFDGFALTDHPIPSVKWLEHGGHQSLDPFIGLSFAAAATERIRLLSHIVVAPYRNPFLMAKAAASLDRLSHGRLVLGLGTGYHKPEYFALGVEFDERNALFDEALQVMPKAWSGEPFDAEGLHFSARSVIQRPVPTQQPIPMWIGGNSKRARERAATLGQGWIPMGVSPQIAQTARSQHITSIAELATLITEVKDMAGPRADQLDFCMSYHDDALIDPTADVQRHVDGIAELAEAGIGWAVIGRPPGEPKELLDFIQAFGDTYCRG